MQKQFNSSSTNPSEKPQPGDLALYEAVVRRQYHTVSQLLRDGYPDINETNAGTGETALHALAGNGEICLVAELVSLGADVNAADFTSTRPLHKAAQDGSTHVAAALLAAGADIDAMSDDGQTALHSAALKGDERMCRFLVGRGANFCLQNMSGYTAADMARRYSCDFSLADWLDTRRLRQEAASAKTSPAPKTPKPGQ
ncbi:MAG: ankyrin repeat domain-containing protein [Alphaproteobacteria bacterium]